jgi:uncharacterized membrane protein YtjA (UPF0391 family)
MGSALPASSWREDCTSPTSLSRRREPGALGARWPPGAVDTECESSLIWREHEMLRWALIFLVIALVAALLGFGGLAGAATGIAKILFFIFLVIFVVSLILHLVRRV